MARALVAASMRNSTSGVCSSFLAYMALKRCVSTCYDVETGEAHVNGGIWCVV